MVTKRFFRLSLDSIFFQAILLAGFGFDVYACVVSTIQVISFWGKGDNGLGVFVMVIFYLGIPMIGYLESTFLVGLIRLEPDGIMNKGDNRIGRDKIQYPAYVRYEEITSVSIVPYQKASNGKYASMVRPVPFLFVVNAKGKTMRFSLHFMSVKTIQRLLEDLQKNLGISGCKAQIDVETLLRDFKEARFATKE